MFDWLFRPTCPVEADDKKWLEGRMVWLTREFGLERLLDVRVILPTPKFFPDPYQGEERDVRALFKRVCRSMKIPREDVRLRFFEDERQATGHGAWEGRLEGAAGTYEGGRSKDTISINVAQLNDPEGLVGTMAHELAHVHLLSHGRVSRDAADHEPLTDLATVFLGLGIFTANATLREKYWTEGQMTGWSIGRQGYLSQRMFGYAFALFAWARGEDNPEWAGHLRLDVRSAFKKGLRYLRETADSDFKPMRLTKSPNDGARSDGQED
jgi:hypothetical protein